MLGSMDAGTDLDEDTDTNKGHNICEIRGNGYGKTWKILI